MLPFFVNNEPFPALSIKRFNNEAMDTKKGLKWGGVVLSVLLAMGSCKKDDDQKMDDTSSKSSTEKLTETSWLISEHEMSMGDSSYNKLDSANACDKSQVLMFDPTGWMVNYKEDVSCDASELEVDTSYWKFSEDESMLYLYEDMEMTGDGQEVEINELTEGKLKITMAEKDSVGNVEGSSTLTFMSK